MAALCAGVDPGRRGAAALGGAGRLVRLVGWWPCSRDGRDRFLVRMVAPSGEVLEERADLRTYWQIGSLLARWFSPAFAPRLAGLAAEDPVLTKNPRTTILGARNAGRLVAPLEHLAPGLEAAWVSNSRWKSLIVGNGRADVEEVERAVRARASGASAALDRIPAGKRRGDASCAIGLMELAAVGSP